MVFVAEVIPHNLSQPLLDAGPVALVEDLHSIGLDFDDFEHRALRGEYVRLASEDAIARGDAASFGDARRRPISSGTIELLLVRPHGSSEPDWIVTYTELSTRC